jgi:hypothetical protein
MPLILIFYRVNFDAGYRVHVYIQLKLFQAFFWRLWFWEGIIVLFEVVLKVFRLWSIADKSK